MPSACYYRHCDLPFLLPLLMVFAVSSASAFAPPLSHRRSVRNRNCARQHIIHVHVNGEADENFNENEVTERTNLLEESSASANNDNNNQQPNLQLQRLGWQPYFANQLLDDNNDEGNNNNNPKLNLNELTPVRITEVCNNGLHIVGTCIDTIIPHSLSEVAVVGDWILVDYTASHRPKKILDRNSLMKRRAPGRGRKIQLIAANLDTVFIVTSCNQDFNVARLERYVAMVVEANITPVIVITKRDHYGDDEESLEFLDFYIEEANAICIAGNEVPVVLLDARGEEPSDKLNEWCRPGQTVAFLGSSGVGKSTLVNALCGERVAATGDIHDDSGQGRHTTTRKQLHFLPNGCSILDTPGLRELQLVDAAYGVAEVFADLVELSHQCRFNDCKHAGEPGCAIQGAIENGEIDEERMGRWEKLVEEDKLNSKIMAESESKLKAKSKGNKKTVPKSQQKKNRKYKVVE